MTLLDALLWNIGTSLVVCVLRTFATPPLSPALSMTETIGHQNLHKVTETAARANPPADTHDNITAGCVGSVRIWPSSV